MSLMVLIGELARTNSPTLIGKITATVRRFGFGRLSNVPLPWNASHSSSVLAKPMSISPELTSGIIVPVPLEGCTRDCMLPFSPSTLATEAPSA